jgi:hypothetical protein
MQMKLRSNHTVKESGPKSDSLKLLRDRSARLKYKVFLEDPLEDIPMPSFSNSLFQNVTFL